MTMKKYIIPLFSLLLLITACSDDKYERLNEDPKNPESVPAGFLFSNATKSLSDQNANLNVNTNIFRFISQYLTATTYLDEPNYELRERNIPQNHWSVLYRNVLRDLKDAKETVLENEDLLTQEEVDARVAQITVIEVYTWQFLVDTFSDIPYSEALAKDNYLPKYDNAAGIYEDLIMQLIAINSDFAGQGFSSQDLIYGGDMAKWQKFSNSLLLRLGARLINVNATLANDAIQAATTNGVMTSNDDNALFNYLDSPPNTNPIWEDVIQSGRNDYVAANTIIDYMNTLDDPRRMAYFDDNVSGYIGGTYGAESPYGSHTHLSDKMTDPSHPGILMDYAEVEFLLAQAAAEGVGGVSNAASHYENGITASITYWTGDSSLAAAYLAQPGVSYNAANWKELVGKQFWIAMFDNPMQGWYVWRKLNNPTLNTAAQSGNPVPLRYTYPINEQNLNAANYEAGSAAIGGDDQQTPLFWDED